MSSNVTLKQIAEAVGLSAMTVSRALNNRSNVDEKTREKILKTARRMGYIPNHTAKSLVTKKTFIIGVVIPEIAHTFFAEVVSGIEKVAYKMNYQLLLTNSAEDAGREKKVLETLQSQRVDGILISCSETTKDFSYYKKIIQTGLPLVFFDRCVKGLGASTVSVDDRTGSKESTRHMISHGYKKIAYLRGPDIPLGNERLEGYLEGLRENSLPVHKEWIVESGFREKGGYEAMKNLLSLPADKRPRAVMAVNDPAAIGAIQAIEESGLSIPGDIAICGFSDDIRARLLNPGLTTVKQPAERIGKTAAEKLIRQIENDDEPVESLNLSTSLVIRESCGC